MPKPSHQRGQIPQIGLIPRLNGKLFFWSALLKKSKRAGGHRVVQKAGENKGRTLMSVVTELLGSLDVSMKVSNAVKVQPSH